MLGREREKMTRVTNLLIILIEERTHLDITRQQVTRHDNKINNNSLNKPGMCSNNTGIISQAPVHAGKSANETEPQSI